MSQGTARDGDARTGAVAASGGLSAITFWIAGGIVVADQATKALVRARLPLHASETIIPGLLDLTHVRNTGAAFGILGGVDLPYKAAFIALLATAALVAVAAYAAQLSPHQKLARVGLALILGGAVGNLIDRVTLGYVLDFVDVYWGDWHFWAFNVADAAISVGVVGMLLDLALPARPDPHR
ncbi:MAG TPA: signal peptidase II [Vicinamibacterales bacterium]|nr:signal peptidase II [Vicinamibacterales bacterium]